MWKWLKSLFCRKVVEEEVISLDDPWMPPDVGGHEVVDGDHFEDVSPWQWGSPYAGGPTC